MKEKFLLKIGFICSIIGIISLYIISSNIEISESSLNKINNENIDETIKVKGIITRQTNLENMIILNLKQENEITVIMFNTNTSELKQGDTIEVTGKVEEYKGEEEIIADEVVLIK